MENSQLKRNKIRKKRALHVRKHVRGSTDKPRLSVVRTNQHIHVQLIDDDRAATLASASTISKENRSTEFNRKNKTSAKHLGLQIAEIAKQKQVTKVVFDRGYRKYHGLIAAVAEGAREGGLEF